MSGAIHLAARVVIGEGGCALATKDYRTRTIIAQSVTPLTGKRTSVYMST